MWLAARGVKNIDGQRGPRFRPVEPGHRSTPSGAAAWRWPKRTLAQSPDLDAGRLVTPFEISTDVDFAYHLFYPKAKGRPL